MCKKPNFFIVGAAKSGTTSLAKYLEQHKDIFLSPIKEPFFMYPIMAGKTLTITDPYSKEQAIQNGLVKHQRDTCLTKTHLKFLLNLTLKQKSSFA